MLSNLEPDWILEKTIYWERRGSEFSSQFSCVNEWGPYASNEDGGNVINQVSQTQTDGVKLKSCGAPFEKFGIRDEFRTQPT